MEHLLQPARQRELEELRQLFQSLFLWNIYFNIAEGFADVIVSEVSILIFMEHLLQRT